MAKKQSSEALPLIGFGTGQLHGTEAERAVQWALQNNYRLIDTAANYGNETQVGRAIACSGIPREDIKIITKGAHDPGEHGYSQLLEQFDNSLRRLALNYIDYYLVHWPSNPQARLETWRAMEAIQQSGRARYIGVSNYSIHHLDELNSGQRLLPVINEIEFHPYIFDEQRHVVDACKERNISVIGYATFANGQGDADKIVRDIAAKHNKTLRQILTRWAIQHGIIPLVRSV